MGQGWGCSRFLLVVLLDCDFQGESFVKLYNKTDELITINPGERLVQLVIVPVLQVQLNVVEAFKETQRGTGGFGSTGGK